MVCYACTCFYHLTLITSQPAEGLLTVECETIVHVQPFHLKENAQSITFPIKGEWIPNAQVRVILVRTKSLLKKGKAIKHFSQLFLIREMRKGYNFLTLFKWCFV